MQPLRREWQESRESIANLLSTGKARPTGKEKPLSKGGLDKAHREARALLRQFHERLAHIKVLDPACGSGNFLYVTLQKLKDLEKEVLVYAGDNQLGSFFGQIGPWQFYGIEINPYAFELAQTTLWIGTCNGSRPMAWACLRSLFCATWITSKTWMRSSIFPIRRIRKKLNGRRRISLLVILRFLVGKGYVERLATHISRGW